MSVCDQMLINILSLCDVTKSAAMYVCLFLKDFGSVLFEIPSNP